MNFQFETKLYFAFYQTNNCLFFICWQQAPSSRKKSKAIIIHAGDAKGQNPFSIEHESDISENDFKLRQDYENVKEEGDGRPANYKSHVLNQENVHESTYDADDDADYD